VSRVFFPLPGVTPRPGRSFSPQADTRTAARTVMLSEVGLALAMAVPQVLRTLDGSAVPRLEGLQLWSGAA